jgi:phage terminase large subunit
MDGHLNWSIPPDYIGVFEERGKKLEAIRADKDALPALKVYYKDHIADFINDWGVTFDPRNVGTDKPAYLPFLLFDRQREWVDWFLEAMKENESRACEKSRDMGVSWLAVSTAASLCLFNENMAIGFGSRKEEYVDKLDDPKSLFWKARQFINELPPEFTGSWHIAKHTPHMRLIFPDTKSIISGESGDNIGRGDRTRVYVVDEAAYLERPQLIEASLSQTTNCRIDVSSANGTANPFYQKRSRWAGSRRLFTFHWTQDPRKDQAWYDKQVRDLDSVVVAQEIDIDYSASVDGVIIPAAWIQAAVNAHKKLGWEASGAARAAFDVGDQRDKNALIGGIGTVIDRADQWSGKDGDIYKSTQRAFAFCDDNGYRTLVYDADGMGAGVRGDAVKINESREGREIETIAYRGGEGVHNPEREDEQGRQNKDFFKNHKAQAWWRARKVFERTWRAVTKGIRYEPSELISLDSDGLGSLLPQIMMELGQPVFKPDDDGKRQVDKVPDGAYSPNLADGVVMWLDETGDKPAAFFEEEDMLVDAAPVPVPNHCESVYATVHVSGKPGKDNMGAAVIYWASFVDNDKVVALGWDYTEIEGNILDGWIPKVFSELDRLGSTAHLGHLGIYLSDEGSNEIVAEKAGNHGDTTLIDGKIAKLAARDQALSVSTYVTSKRVRLSADAVNKRTEFKGSKRNHLTFQLKRFTPEMKDVEEWPLLRAFVYGISIALEDEGG